MWSNIIPIVLVVFGAVSLVLAVFYERRMHRHRLPGVSYAEATFRRDGGWRRTDLFSTEGLENQRRASRYGLLGVLLWIVALLSYIIAALRP